MRRIQLLTSMTLLAVFATAAAGCGANGMMTGPRAGKAGFAARNIDWDRPTTMIDLTQEHGFEEDMPPGDHPFASPLKYRLFPKKEVGRVLELAAPANDKPSRGFLVTGVDDESAASFLADPEDEESEKLAKRIRITYKWGVNTSVPTKDVAIAAMPVFIVEYVKAKKKIKDDDGKETIKEITDKVAIGYAWSNSLDPNQLLPIVKPQQVTSMRINFDGEEIPLRFITKQKGYGLQDPCSEDAFHAIPLVEEKIDTFVKDVHTAFPYTYKPVTPSAGPENVTDELPVAFGEAPDTNVNLKGIVAVGFGAQIPAGVCSQAVFGAAVTVQRNND